MKKVNPRRGSLQFWPHKRASKEVARVRKWHGDNGVLGFAGYKVGMTSVKYVDNSKTSLMKGQEIVTPATIIECPPMKAVAVRYYKNTEDGEKVVKESKKAEDIEFDDLSLVVETQPKLTGIGKKKPSRFEVAVGGKKEDQLNLVKEKLGKDINIADVLGEGQLIDIHAVTKGKGFQGAVKRHGVKKREAKAEKGKRTAGSLGPWKGEGHIMWRIPYPGKMGYHLRTDYNKWVLSIVDKPDNVNPDSGFHKYGLVKNPYILLKGSLPGPKKRLVTFTHAARPKSNVPKEAPAVEYIK